MSNLKTFFTMYNIIFNPQTPQHLKTQLTSLFSQSIQNFQNLLAPITDLDIYISLATPSNLPQNSQISKSTHINPKPKTSPNTPPTIFAMQHYHNPPIINPHITSCSPQELRSGLSKILHIDQANLAPNRPSLHKSSAVFHLH